MENDADIDEIEYVSKSQLKRDSLALQDLGKRLAELSADQLARIPLDAQLREAIELAHRIRNKRSALKRHFQYIGKLLRARDPEPIRAALADIDREGQQSIQRHHRAEAWRDRIVEQGNSAIDALLDELPAADRQKLRQLLRNFEHAGSDGKKTEHARQIYREIFQLLE
ncbi:MAG: ribosome biogenesis factor YjgA [Gammaproteobacteria bacterium]|nr:ribosome biogenesis factor YjgA [Gammaproteobacteria bacterium]